MPYELDNRLVIGVSSGAVFDHGAGAAVFAEKGEDEYRRYQEARMDEPLPKGVAFSFIKRLLSLNDLSPGPDDPLVEIVLLSKNDPGAGLRVMNSLAHYGLDVSRAIFMQGKSPYEYIPALNISLFLSANKNDIEGAIKKGFPAGKIVDSAAVDDPGDNSLRLAFDFDGVLADDESEAVMHRTNDVSQFHDFEVANVTRPHNPGPLKEFLVRVSKIMAIEEAHKRLVPGYTNRLTVSIVTARSAPAHERALNTLKSWGVRANNAFFLGGVDKGKVLSVLRPHIFFDDQSRHLKSSSAVAPSVHIPFGIRNI